jgi:hypothetical protein
MMLQFLGWFSFIWGTLGFLAVTCTPAKKFPHLLARSIIVWAIPLYWIVAAICWSHQ